MAAERIADMTLDELRTLIESIVAEHTGLAPLRTYIQQGDRPISEVLESIRSNLIESKPGDPGVVEMIREDRDR